MARGTGKDHARWPLSLWGEDTVLDLTPRAQHLLFVLWHSPELSYCGSGDWHPGRIASKAKGWTAQAVESAGAELARDRILIIDPDTEEYLLRFWIAEDGICRQPNMAVSMANARADLSSRSLRGVVVHEVLKVQALEPDLSAWKRDAVAKLLTQKAIDPADLEPYNPTLNPSANPSVYPNGNPYADPSAKGYGHPGVDPDADPGPTPAPAPYSSSILQKGLLTGERHQGTAIDPNGPRPSDRCSEYDKPGHPRRCGACADARREAEAWDQLRHAADEARRRAFLRELDECQDCDPNGWALDPETREPAEPAVRCRNHEWETANARA
ncbi:hypothetical protein [Mycolicibacterium fortuitum]|uniref:hypothetical protein n=1 Tax=Mycolicibacterium fortuitum TaxID=1766 RepID=UPI00096DA9FC|nr:hypothetical protein [Mycolicibacterium fortuitum]OMC12514.1 hypothetical protein A5734_00840 [Mycolicibacterium fortuitum]